MNAGNQNDVRLWIQGLINENRLHEFYVSGYWLQLRAEVLREDKHECQQCKRRGYYKRANTVHHVQHVRKHPGLVLSKTYTFQGRELRNLISLCHDCHEEVHEYRKKKKAPPLTPERW